MSYFERYEQWRDKMYGGPKYTPDAYLGAALNDTEKRMVEETLPEGYQANLRSLGSVFVPEENRYVQKLELNLSPEEQGTWKRSNMVIGDHMGQLHFSDPLVEAYAQVAYNRANMQLASWRQGPVLPEVEDIWSKYPGVDPWASTATRTWNLPLVWKRSSWLPSMPIPSARLRWTGPLR